MTAENTGYFHKESMEDLIGQRNSLLELRDNLQKQLSTQTAENARLKEACKKGLDTLRDLNNKYVTFVELDEKCEATKEFMKQALAGGGKKND